MTAVTEWTAKPLAVRVCGPWDGSDEAARKFSEFIDEFSKLAGGSDFDEAHAEYWDERRSRWTRIPDGWYLVVTQEEPFGWFTVVDAETLSALYQPALRTPRSGLSI